MRVQGFRIEGLRFKVQCLEVCMVNGFLFRCLGFGVEGYGIWVKAWGFGVDGLIFRVKSKGFRV